jgi:hypothetical protein
MRNIINNFKFYKMKELNLEKLATLQGGGFWSTNKECRQLSDGSYYRQTTRYRFWFKTVGDRGISNKAC